LHLSIPLLHLSFYYLVFQINYTFIFVTDVGDEFNCLPIHVASKENNCPVLLALIDNGADVNAKGFNGQTPLHVTVHLNNNLTMMKMVLMMMVMVVIYVAGGEVGYTI